MSGLNDEVEAFAGEATTIYRPTIASLLHWATVCHTRTLPKREWIVALVSVVRLPYPHEPAAATNWPGNARTPASG